MHERETERLTLRQIRTEDKEHFYELLKCPDVLRYCFDTPSDEALHNSFTGRLPEWNAHSEHWLCLVVHEKSSGDFVGVTGFIKTKDIAEVGFMFLPQYFGRGFATESLISVLDYANSQGIVEFTANITEGNIGSMKVLEKCGFGLVNTSADSVSIGGKAYSNLEYTFAFQSPHNKAITGLRITAVKVFMNTEAQIIELEKSLLTFEVRHSELELRKRIAPNFKEIGASGAYFGLDNILERLPTEQSWSATVQDFQFTQHSDDICQLVFRAFIKGCEADEGTYSLRSSLWQKFGNEWKIIFHQGTKIEPFELSP